MGRLDGKTALITGGASGIGRRTAERFAEEGARVVVSDLNGEGAEATAKALGGNALALAHDVTDEASWNTSMERTLGHVGRLDILVNSAGIGTSHNIEKTTFDEWRNVMAINADGTFLGCRAGVLAMKAHKGGSIVNLSSVSGLVGGHNLCAYNASKGAVRLLTKSVALHCARRGYGIRCNSVHPAFIKTPMVEGLITRSEDRDLIVAKLKAQIPLGRLGEADEVADMIVYLASDESRFVTGAEFVIDGGLTAA